MLKYIEKINDKIIEQDGDKLRIITQKGNKVSLATLELEPSDKKRLTEYLTKLKRLEEKQESYTRNSNGYTGPKMTIILSILMVGVLFVLNKAIANNGYELIMTLKIIEKLTLPIISIGIATDIFMKIITDNSKNLLEETNTKLEYHRNKTSLVVEQIITKSKVPTHVFTLPETIKNTKEIYKYVIEQEKNNTSKPKITRKIPGLGTPKDLTQDLRVERIERLKNLKKSLLSTKEEKTKLPKPDTKQLKLKGRTTYPNKRIR